MIAIEDPTGAGARFCVESYYAELDARFEGGFDPGRSGAPDAAVFAEPGGLFVVARLRGEPVGCGGLRLGPSGSAEIKRMWVAPSARGHGLGRRLLGELERLARARGANAVRLDSNRALGEAIALYRSAGYVEVEPFNDDPYADFFFEKRLDPGGDRR